MSTKLTWLITGASTGFGYATAKAALSAGHRVIGTSRSVDKARKHAPEFEEAGGIWAAVELGDTSASRTFVELAERYEVDVLVNNAGYAAIGLMEDWSDEEVNAQMNVNFYGPMRAIRAVIPGMRSRRRGTIINISSAMGLFARASRGLYAASKFALEGASEALVAELEPFGIRVLVIEPGAFRTSMSASHTTPARYARTSLANPAYEGTVGMDVMRATMAMGGDESKMPGDPDKAGRLIVEMVDGTGEGGKFDGFRIPFGRDCMVGYEIKVKSLQEDLDKSRDIGGNLAFDGVDPLGSLKK